MSNITNTYHVILVRVRGIIAATLGIDLAGKIREDTHLTEDLGADNLAKIKIILTLENAFGIDIPEPLWGAPWTAGRIAHHIEDRLYVGRFAWNENFLALTEDEFDARYEPETDVDGGLYRQRDWNVPEDLAALKAAEAELRAWTMVADDDGDFCIVSGIAYVDRLYYIITAKPREGEELFVTAQEAGIKKTAVCAVIWDESQEDQDVLRMPPVVAFRLLDTEKEIGVWEINDATSALIADYIAEKTGRAVKAFDFKIYETPGDVPGDPEWLEV